MLGFLVPCGIIFLTGLIGLIVLFSSSSSANGLAVVGLVFTGDVGVTFLGKAEAGFLLTISLSISSSSESVDAEIVVGRDVVLIITGLLVAGLVGCFVLTPEDVVFVGWTGWDIVGTMYF